jgi:Protein of unknown function (DUF3306)
MGKPVAPEPDAGFLSRWSRRKAQAREGEPPLPEPTAAAPEPAAQVKPAARSAADSLSGHDLAHGQLARPVQAVQPGPSVNDKGDEAAGPASPEAPPPPTLAEAAALDSQADFTRFVARGVAPEVKNAALKKLFADPHFNVMDGLDTYIDDYGKPDPLPASMLRKMAQARFLGLFTDDDEAPASTPAITAAASSTGPVASPAPPTATAPHEDPDLRLQPDHAAGREDPAPSADGDARREP